MRRMRMIFTLLILFKHPFQDHPPRAIKWTFTTTFLITSTGFHILCMVQLHSPLKWLKSNCLASRVLWALSHYLWMPPLTVVAMFCWALLVSSHVLAEIKVISFPRLLFTEHVIAASNTLIHEHTTPCLKLRVSIYLSISFMCVCVCERERERESVCVCVYL